MENLNNLEQSNYTLVTGATGGIGQAVCQQLSAQGIPLILTGRNFDELNHLAQSLRESHHSEIKTLECDVNDIEQIEQLFIAISQEKLTLSGLVHCAGQLSESLLMMTKTEIVEQSLSCNLHSAIYFAQKSSRLMMKNKSGVITFISSIVANQGAAGQSVYGAAKAGLQGLTQSLSKELGAFGIRVNSVSPGFVETALVEHYNEDKKRQLLENTSLKRLGQADDVANLITFLHSNKAQFITGQNIGVDGGLIL